MQESRRNIKWGNLKERGAKLQNKVVEIVYEGCENKEKKHKRRELIQLRSHFKLAKVDLICNASLPFVSHGGGAISPMYSGSKSQIL